MLENLLFRDLVEKKVPFVLFQAEDDQILLALCLQLHISPIAFPKNIKVSDIFTNPKFPNYFFYVVTDNPPVEVEKSVDNYLKNYLRFCDYLIQDEEPHIC